MFHVFIIYVQKKQIICKEMQHLHPYHFHIKWTTFNKNVIRHDKKQDQIKTREKPDDWKT